MDYGKLTYNELMNLSFKEKVDYCEHISKTYNVKGKLANNILKENIMLSTFGKDSLDEYKLYVNSKMIFNE